MKRDARLHCDPTTRDHYASVREGDSQLEASVSDAAWISMAEGLVVAMRSRVVSAVARFPVGADTRFERAFGDIASALAEGRSLERLSREGRVLERRVADDVARSTSLPARDWERIFQRFDDWEAKQRFVEGLPVSDIEAAALDMMRMPSDRASWLDSLRPVEGGDADLLAHLDTAREKAVDAWEWLDSIEPFVNQTHVGMPLIFRSELFGRVHPTAYVTWLGSLPHAFYAGVVIDNIDDLDWLEALIANYDGGWCSEPTTHVILLLLIRRFIAVCEGIGSSLAHAANLEGLAAAVRDEYSQLLKTWDEVEFPRRCRLVVSLLLRAPRDREHDPLVDILRHLRSTLSRRRHERKECSAFRSLLIEAVPLADAEVIAKAITESSPNAASLASGTLLARRVGGAAAYRPIVEAYGRWLRLERFSWSSPLEGDDLTAVTSVATALSESSEPVTVAENVLRDVEVSSEGWMFSLDAWFKSASRLAHACIVVVVCSERFEGRGDTRLRNALFDVVWIRVHAWLRAMPMEYGDEMVRALEYVWAYAGKYTLPGEACAKALESIDNVRHAVSAATNYAGNATAARLPPEAREALRRKFEENREILRRERADNSTPPFEGLVRAVEGLTR